jgi:AbrB family looped-hinge helix DNA binding protein
MIKSVSVKGQLVLPRKMRLKYGITPGSPVSICDTGNGILIEPLRGDISKAGFAKKSKIDGGPVLSFNRKQMLTSAQVAKLMDETQ